MPFVHFVFMKSTSKKESVRVLIEPKPKSRTQTTFPLNVCQFGIEKYEHGTQTKYEARVKNCDGFSPSFQFTLNFKPSGSARIYSRDLNGQGIQRFSEYFKYAKTYYISSDKDTYYAILNNRAMKEDGVTITDFQFYIGPNWKSPISPDDVVTISDLTYVI